MTDDYDEDRKSGKEIYDSIMSYLYHNTGGYQPPIIRQPPLVNAVCRTVPCKGDRARSVISRCVGRGDIFRWKDSRDDRLYIGVDDPEVLREKIGSYAQRREDPRKDLISVANRRISAIKSQ